MSIGTMYQSLFSDITPILCTVFCALLHRKLCTSISLKYETQMISAGWFLAYLLHLKMGLGTGDQRSKNQMKR